MNVRFLTKTLKSFTINSNMTKTQNLIFRIPTNICGCQQNHFSTKQIGTYQTTKNVDPEIGDKIKKKTLEIQKITLINGDQLSVTSLDEAKKLSKRRDLKLVKIVDLDTKTQRPVYKLMTGSEYHAEDLKQREQKKKEKQKSSLKGEKVVILSHNISEHDLQTHTKKIVKWLEKSYEVRVVINGDSANMDKAEKVYGYFETSVGAQGRFLQKRLKSSDIKFQILPPKKIKDHETKDPEL